MGLNETAEGKKSNEYLHIKATIKSLEKQKKELEEKLEKHKLEAGASYENFFINKRNKEFVLYNRFPSSDLLSAYISEVDEDFSLKFPLFKYGYFNIKELAEIIKYCYQFQRGSEYDILTVGGSNYEVFETYCGKTASIEPHLYFIVGNNKTLAPFKEFDGQYINDDSFHHKISPQTNKKDLIFLEAGRSYYPDIDIECLTGNENDVLEYVNFFDKNQDEYNRVQFSLNKNIYDEQIIDKVNIKGEYGYNGIKDILDFRVHISDTFLAKILVSISIYKRNNNIDKLITKDYNHIFEVLYGEKVYIKENTKTDIPKKLIYVPNK